MDGRLPAIGFIGLGDQGEPMAHRIEQGGWPLHLWARRAESLEPFRATSALRADSPRELARAVEILCLCTFAEEDLHDLIFREPDGIAGGLEPGKILIIHSTVSPEACMDIQAKLAPLGVSVMDAPVSGGRQKAFAGELAVMVGGNPDIFDRINPLLRTYGETVRLLGPLGSGQKAKMINNALMICNMQLADEAIAIARELGIDQAALQDLLLGSSAFSTSLEFVVALHRGAQSPASGPGIIRKDIGLFERMCAVARIDTQELGVVASRAASRATALLRIE